MMSDLDPDFSNNGGATDSEYYKILKFFERHRIDRNNLDLAASRATSLNDHETLRWCLANGASLERALEGLSYCREQNLQNLAKTFQELANHGWDMEVSDLALQRSISLISVSITTGSENFEFNHIAWAFERGVHPDIEYHQSTERTYFRGAASRATPATSSRLIEHVAFSKMPHLFELVMANGSERLKPEKIRNLITKTKVAGVDSITTALAARQNLELFLEYCPRADDQNPNRDNNDNENVCPLTNNSDNLYHAIKINAVFAIKALLEHGMEPIVIIPKSLKIEAHTLSAATFARQLKFISASELIDNFVVQKRRNRLREEKLKGFERLDELSIA